MTIEDFYDISLSEDEKKNTYEEFKAFKKDIEEEFSKKTKLDKKDFTFLFFAIALQLARQYLLGGKLGESFNKEERIKDNDKTMKKSIQKERELYKEKKYSKGDKIIESTKGYRTWIEIAMTNKVPYDVITGSRDLGLNLGGPNHRLKTLGHDPILGWIFGTANILTDTVTLINLSTYKVDMNNGLKFSSQINILELFQNTYESIYEDWLRLPAAVFAQGLHLKSDEFTKIGLPVPTVGIFNEELAEKLSKNNYDSICAFRDLKTIGNQAFFSYMINEIIALIHKFYYNEEEGTEELYQVKTRKILLYSNIIASSSNIIASQFLGNNKYLDIGGFAVTLHRMFTDISFIKKVKEEFVHNKIDEKYQKDIDELNSEINLTLEKLGIEERI